jgi:hypothetical protein
MKALTTSFFSLIPAALIASAAQAEVTYWNIEADLFYLESEFIDGLPGTELRGAIEVEHNKFTFGLDIDQAYYHYSNDDLSANATEAFVAYDFNPAFTGYLATDLYNYGTYSSYQLSIGAQYEWSDFTFTSEVSRESDDYEVVTHKFASVDYQRDDLFVGAALFALEFGDYFVVNYTQDYGRLETSATVNHYKLN